MTSFAFTSVGDKEIHNGRMHQTVIAAPEIKVYTINIFAGKSPGYVFYYDELDRKLSCC